MRPEDRIRDAGQSYGCSTALHSPRVHRGCLFVPVLIIFLGTGVAITQDSIRLTCSPRTFQVVPGEPMRLELTVEAPTGASIRLRIPANPALVLRAVEKLPVRRTTDGVIVHKRVVIWQAIEPGSVKMDGISVETAKQEHLFPAVTISVSDPGT